MGFEWRVRDGVMPIPQIGPGPFTDEEYEALEAAYMAPWLADDPEARRPRDSWLNEDGNEVGGVYVRVEVALPDEPAAEEQE